MKQLKLLSKCKSKVIVCGVGKSGKIASKISQLYLLLEHHLFLFLQMTVLMVI